MPSSFSCPHCGHVTIVADEFLGTTGPCSSCNQTITIPADLPPQVTGPRLGDDATTRMLLPVGRSVWAIAAGYAGLISVLCFPAPVALVLGIVAIRDIKSHPDKHGMGRAVFGLVMGLIGTLTMIFFLGAAALGD